MRSALVYLSMVICLGLSAQTIRPSKVKPDSNSFDNVYVKKIAEDSLQSTFIIWVKNGVPSHYHAHHTEILHVLAGKGEMTVGDETFTIRKGDYFIIPMGISHSVITTSRKALKVISVQSPKFDGDRIWIKP